MAGCELVTDDGYNLDPAKCDCGKGAYCPLWENAKVRRFYGSLSEADRNRITGSEA